MQLIHLLRLLLLLILLCSLYLSTTCSPISQPITLSTTQILIVAYMILLRVDIVACVHLIIKSINCLTFAVLYTTVNDVC